MSVREKCISILDTFDEEQMLKVIAVLADMRREYDELEDEMFCEKMMEEYENDPDKGDPVPIEEFAAQLGIEL